ncbi:MAG: OmpA family protein [Fuerstiella sp.]
MLTRKHNLFAIAILICLLSGCGLSGRRAHREHLKASQLRSQELFAENEQLLLSQSQQQQIISGLEQDRQGLSEHLGQLESQLATANTRIDNLLAERTEIKDRYARALTDTTTDSFGTGTGDALPGFDYDPLTGLSKFPEDLLFDLGSANLRPEALPVLKEFASRVSSGGAEGLRILVVGHTDDQAISRPSTARQHPTNWHLSTDRADQVVVELEKLGVAPERMAAMGYSRFQPLETSTDESARQRNRRVELYVVPQAANMTAWDPVRLLN